MAISTYVPTLSTALIQQRFNRHDLFPPQPDVLWKIEQGAVRTSTRSEAGATTTLGYWGQGDVVGYPLCRVNPYQIKCLTSVEVSLLPAQLWYQALDAILQHTQQVEELLNILHQDTHDRLLQFSIWLARKFGQEVEQGQLINLPLTHQDIAEVIGTTRVTVTRLIKQLKQEGILDCPRRNCILLRPGLLSESWQSY